MPAPPSPFCNKESLQNKCTRSGCKTFKKVCSAHIMGHGIPTPGPDRIRPYNPTAQLHNSSSSRKDQLAEQMAAQSHSATHCAVAGGDVAETVRWDESIVVERPQRAANNADGLLIRIEPRAGGVKALTVERCAPRPFVALRTRDSFAFGGKIQ